MRNKKLFKIGGFLATGLLISGLIFCCSTSLVASDSNATTSKTETTSKKQETINEDILPKSEEAIKENEDIVYTTASLNVRKEPNINSERVGILEKNSKLKRIEDNDNGWDAIEVAGVKYYVSDQYLTTTKPETFKEVTELLPISTSTPDVSVEKMTINSWTEGRYPLEVQLSENDKQILAALVWLEGRGEPIECQRAIASVVLNRMMVNGLSLHDVVYAPNQFTPANRIESTRATQDISNQVAIVEDICMQGTSVPRYVLYFRSGHYFNWSTLENYGCIGNTYFSSLKSLM